MDGTLALQISNETVPDLAMAKVDLNNIFFFIFSSDVILQFFKLDSDKNLFTRSLNSWVAWNT